MPHRPPRATVLGCVLVLLAAAPARAQHTPAARVPADTARGVVLPTVEVTATGGQTADATRTAHAVRLTRRDLDALRTATLADALERTGTASIRRYGPSGLATVSLRGAASSQTAVLVDGVRLVDPVVGSVDLSLVPTAVVGAVTTVAGAASAWHGTDAVAGTVLVDTRRMRGVDVQLGVASASTATLDVAAGAGLWTVAVGAEASGGDFAYRDATVFPAVAARRQGADWTRASALVRLDAGPTRAGLWLATADRGLPGAAGTPASAAARQRDALARVWAAHAGRWGRVATWRATAWAHAARLDYRGPGSTSRSIPRTVGANVAMARAMARMGALSTTVHVGASAARTSVRNASLTAAPVERQGAVWAGADLRRGRLSATPALRLDVLDQGGTVHAPLSPRLGLRADVARAWAVRASAGRAFRAPSLSDRFWRGAGRDDLRAERGWTADAGVDAGARRGEASLTGFVRRMDDEIVWRPGADGVWRPGNVRRTSAWGLDASARAAAGPVDVRASAAWVDARDRSGDAATDGKALPYVPHWTLRSDARAAVALSLIHI